MNVKSLTIQLHGVVQKFRSNGIVLLDQAIVSGGNFMLGILLTRFLGLEQYGIYTLLWMVLLVALSLNHAFITQPLLSLGPQEKNQASYLNHLLWLQIMFATLACGISFLALLFGEFLGLSIPHGNILLVLPLVIFTHLLYDYFRKRYFLQQQFNKALLMDMLLYGIQLIALCFLAFRQMLSVGNCLLVVLVAQTVIVSLGLAQFLKFSIERQGFKSVFFRHLDYSKWLMGTAILQWFSGNFFLIAGAGILGAVAVGVVRMVQNVLGLTHILFLAMENIVPVRAAQQLNQAGVKPMIQYLKSSTTYASMLVGSVLLGLCLFAPFILKILYGAQYMQHSPIVMAFCGIYVFVFLGYPLRIALRTMEITKPIFIAYVVATIFSLVAAYPMIENWGMSGLLLGFLITQMISLIIYFWYFRNTISEYENHTLSPRKS